MAKAKLPIDGDETNNSLVGTNGADIMLGLGGDDSLFGWGGHDLLFGGNGNDLQNGGSGNDVVTGESGNDRLNGDAGQDVLNGGLGNDVLNGGRGDDTILGEAGADKLAGGAGNDSLSGGDGNDVLMGNAGSDVLEGGGGSDLFLVQHGDGVERILDFGAEDRIDLGAFRFEREQDVLNAFRQVGADAVLALGRRDKLILENFDLASLSAAQLNVSPYLVPLTPKIEFVPLMTVGDTVRGYSMSGIPDGLGAFDNGDGTFTVLMNHELPASEGVVRAHGSTGAFVSRLAVDKATLAVEDAADLIQTVHLYDPATKTWSESTTAFNRFCSADLAEPSAFWDAGSQLGFQGGRLFLNGEESGPEGRAFAHVASGPEAGNSYELAALGNLSFENVVARPTESRRTVVGLLDDGQNGQVYFYAGAKQATGNAVERAGLAQGRLYGLQVAELDNLVDNGNESNGTTLGGDFQSAFNMVSLGNVSGKTGAQLDAMSEERGVTSFLRPEDGAWDTVDANRFYFVTTNGFGAPSRLWAADFVDSGNPAAGGTLRLLLDGSEGQQMLDNMAVNADGKVILCEDVGGNDHLGKVWEYDPTTDTVAALAEHDSRRFAPGGSFFLTNDEESSGVIDVSGILGSDTQNAYLIDTQAQFGLGGELVRGGQLMVMYQDE